jgi:hypothetical protein
MAGNESQKIVDNFNKDLRAQVVIPSPVASTGSASTSTDKPDPVSTATTGTTGTTGTSGSTGASSALPTIPTNGNAGIFSRFDDGDYASAATPAKFTWEISLLAAATGKKYRYEIALSSEPNLEDVQPWLDVGSSALNYTLNLSSFSLTPNKRYYGKIRAFDEQGIQVGLLIGNGFIFLPPIIPGTISISGGSPSINVISVPLSILATNATEMYITNNSDCASGGNWEPYAILKSAWTLGASNTTVVVYIRFRNQLGEISGCINDTIIQDTLAPNPPTNFVSIDGKSPNFTWTPSVDSGSGIDRYEISIGLSPGDISVMNWTSVGNVAAFNFPAVVQTVGTSYYGNIRVYDLAGNVSTIVSSPAFIKQWSQQAYIKAVNGDPDDLFGYSVSLSGDTLGVSAWGEDSNQTTITNGTTASSDNSNSNSGAAYIYQRTAGNWTQQAYIKASNNNAGDRFGNEVSLDNNTFVVGAPLEDSNQITITNGTSASADNSAVDSGAAYVYIRSGSTWSQQAYLKAPNAEAGDQFGYCVAISGDTIAVGAMLEDSSQTTITNGSTASADNSAVDSGAVYVYARAGSTWSQQAYIKASNAGPSDQFSKCLSLNGDTLAVGARYEDNDQTTITNWPTITHDFPYSSDSGAVYVYKRTGTSWAQQAYIKPSNNTAGDSFGYSMSLSGDSLAVGSFLEDSNQTTITNGTTASADNSLVDSGAVYLYTRSGNNWSQQAYLKAPNVGGHDWFGYDISLNQDTLAVGAHREASNQSTITNGPGGSGDNSLPDAGAVYLFKRSASTWAQEAYIKSSNVDDNDNFGFSVSLKDGTLAVGAPKEDADQTTITNGPTASSDNSSINSGAVYIYSLF